MPLRLWKLLQVMVFTKPAEILCIDPLFLISPHMPGNEKPGENTRISDETLAKMAKYVDKISDITNLNRDDYTRRHLVESAFRQYTQKPEEFKKNSSIFKVEFPMGKNPNPVNFCYRDFFHAQHADKGKKNCRCIFKGS